MSDPTFATQEAAIAEAMRQSEPGDIVVIHQPGCAIKGEDGCDCEPIVVTVGDAKA